QGRYTYAYTGDINRDGINGDLMYVPNNIHNLTFATELRNNAGEVIYTATVEEQRAALEAYINNDKYLSARRGQYVERNGVLMPWLNRWDARILQDLFVNAGGRRHSLQISLDIQNVGNLLNPDWGIGQRVTRSEEHTSELQS